MDDGRPPAAPPWRLFDPCPCGSSRQFVGCCLTRGQGLYVQVPPLLPKAPATGYAHPRCYLRHTRDCSTDISAEHFISKVLLEAMGGSIEFTGLPWKAPDEVATLRPNNLVSNILCSRHNNALSPLDAAAGRTFRILQEISRDIAPHNPSQAMDGRWFLVSGEALELWCLKTLFGMFHAKIATHNGMRLIETHTLDTDRFLHALRHRGLPVPCGLYLQAAKGGIISDVHESVSVSPIGSEDGKRVVGVTVGLNRLSFQVVLNPGGINFGLMRQQALYHPWQLLFRNSFRQHMLVMTWRDRQAAAQVVEFSTEAPAAT